MQRENPFTLVKASDYTDAQINDLWVELGTPVIDQIIEPRSRISKFILGGKGTGKTHLLRYFSYPVMRLRAHRRTGLEILSQHKFLAVFLRATGIDAARFESTSDVARGWQQLFGTYLELRLVEGVLDSLCDIKRTSPAEAFNDRGFVAEITRSILDASASSCDSIEALRLWLVDTRRNIDYAVNNAAFTGKMQARIPFSLGQLAFSTSGALAHWHPALVGLPLIFLIDEIENFSISQQQVVNSLIRYGEGLATFRITGRLYARKTLATIGGGEENREGAEFKTVYLDDLLRGYSGYPQFSRRFFLKRLSSLTTSTYSSVRPDDHFQEVSARDWYGQAFAQMSFEPNMEPALRSFTDALSHWDAKEWAGVGTAQMDDVVLLLTQEFPPLLQKLNMLIFCKRSRRKKSPVGIARKIRQECTQFMSGAETRSSYATAYGHYSVDLFAQLCRESRRAVPYAGFDSFVRMSSGNPRNLLILLGRAYAIAAFRELDFIDGSPLAITVQTEATIEAARFTYESDSHYGSQSDSAREATTRLAVLLRSARYALNIPEVSPLTVSFADEDLSRLSKKTLDAALHYSLIYEIKDGRPDRNSQRVNRKIQLNPMLSPRWGLPISRRGDLSLSREVVNAIFDGSEKEAVQHLLNLLDNRWNDPFAKYPRTERQARLF